MIIEKIESPIGQITILIKNQKLLGLWNQDQKYYGCTNKRSILCEPLSDTINFLSDRDYNFLGKIKKWLVIYFSGQAPDFEIETTYHANCTPFQIAVYEELKKISYGNTVSYKYIAKQLNCPSPRAVGGAVSKNPISIIIPCHRVIGTAGSLTGYAGGLDIKSKLLSLEKSLDKK